MNMFKSPGMPTIEKQVPVQQIQQTEDDRNALLKRLAKRRQATVFNQLSDVNIGRNKLGAA